MGVRVAYGKKSKITSAIASGVIPKDSLIITSDAEESELFFYDAAGNMKRISERKQFATISEASQSAGSITIAANGTVPECDIPVTVILLS